MSLTVASMMAVFGADTSQFDAGVGRVKTGLSGIGQSMGGTVQQAGAGMTQIGAQLAMVTAPLAALGTVSINTAKQFDSSIAEISARTGIVGDDLESIKQYALDMGAATAFSSQQAADAFLQLLTSGQTTEQAFATLPAILDAAAASGADLGSTADTITDVMAAYGLSVDQAAAVTDAFAQASASSSADFASLGAGFGNVGPVAKNFGLTVEQTAATLAILSENGIKGAEAGTALKSMLLQMSGTGAAGALGELGVALYDVDGNTRDLNTVLGELDSALDMLPVEDQNRLMKDLAGSYGITALSALRGDVAISDMVETMQGQATAAEIAAKRMDTFAGTADSLGGSVETLQIKAFTPFMNNVLKPLMVDAIGWINIMADWAAAHPEVTTTVISMIAGLSGLSGALLTVGPVVSVLGTMIGALISPLGLVIAAIAGVGLAYKENFLGFADAVNNVGSLLSGWGGKIQEALGGLSIDGGAIRDRITGAISGIVLTAESLDMQAGIGDVVADRLLDVILVALPLVFGGPAGLAIGAAKLVVTAFETDFLGFRTALEESGVITALEDGAGAIWSAISGFLSPSGSGEGGGIDTGGITGVIDGIKTAVQPLIDWVTGLGETLLPGLEDLGGGFVGFVEAFEGTETAGFVTALEALGGALAGFAGLLGPFIEATAAGASAGLSAIGDFLPTLGSSISDFVTALSRLLEGDYAGALESLGSSINTFIGGIADLSTGLFDSLVTSFESLIGMDTTTLTTAFVTLGGDILGAILSGIGDLPVWVDTNLIQPMGAAITGAVESVASWAGELGSAILTGILGALSGLGSALAQAINDAIPDRIDLGSIDLGVKKIDLGSVSLPANPIPTGRAGGGLVQAGVPYRFNEIWAESFVPLQNGRITPQTDASGGGGRRLEINGGTFILQAVQDVNSLFDQLQAIAERRA